MKISVVIPTHNRSKDLRRALQSVLDQTVLPFEVVVVDDGSGVAVEETLFDRFESKLKVTLLRNETPKGANHARNQGVKAASGEFIAFLDDDDKFKPAKVAVIQGALRVNPNVDLVYHPAHIIMENEGIEYLTKPIDLTTKSSPFEELLIQNVIGGTPMTVARKEFLLEVGLFDESIPALEDYELWLRMAKNGCRFGFVPVALTEYEQKTRKKSITKNKESINVARTLIDEKYGRFMDDAISRCSQLNRAREDVLRALLNYDRVSLIRDSFQGFLKFKKFYFWGAMAAGIFGVKVALKVHFYLRSSES